MKTQKLTTEQIKKALPEVYQLIADQSFTHPENGHRFKIKIRTKDIQNKSPLYLWDASSNSFISSLFFCPHTSRFVFDTHSGDTRKFWSINTSLEVKQEEKGFYPNNAELYGIIQKNLLTGNI